jgi:hypothetical protein
MMQEMRGSPRWKFEELSLSALEIRAVEERRGTAGVRSVDGCFLLGVSKPAFLVCGL